MIEPQIALVSERPNDKFPTTWSRYSSLAELLNAENTANILVLDLPTASMHAGLTQLRSDERYRFTQVYSIDAENTAHPLSDGALPDSMDELVKEYVRLNTRLDTFNRGQPPATLEEHVLAWLWTRPQADLAPLRDTGQAQIYEYPLLKAFAGSQPLNEALWLRLMEEQGLLLPGPLTDRIRLCGHCNSGHLNYVDVCPSCKELEISKQPALHCFTCGHVAPQEHFLKDGLLLCPNCLSKLRHIGSDYDRPLENQTCNACRTSFVDAGVQARCLDCGHAQQPDELRIRQIHTYKLSEKARLRCRQGLADTVAGDYFNRLGLISQDSFTHLLNWQIQQSRRYQKAPPTSILGLHLGGLEQLLDSLPGQAVLDSLIERIEQTVRDTDRCSRTREDLLWFLLPHTDRTGARDLAKRMQSMTDLLDTYGNSITIRVTSCTLPHDLTQQETAPLLLARLTGEIRS